MTFSSSARFLAADSTNCASSDGSSDFSLYDYQAKKQPTWFGGLVMGPSSPPMEMTRQRLPKPYLLRWYPDITHCVRCQYPVPWLDPALGMTLGREPVNPRPVDYTQIYQMDYAFTGGFLTYSDGVHDDFNKSLWSRLGWNPKVTPREVAVDYARFFFHPEAADWAADGLFGLETNMRDDLAENGSISAIFMLWRQLEKRMKDPGSPWRFHMHLFRAHYDHYTRLRHRLANDLEQQALLALAAEEGNLHSALDLVIEENGKPACDTYTRELPKRVSLFFPSAKSFRDLNVVGRPLSDQGLAYLEWRRSRLTIPA